jgi:hypothetical protein
MLSRTAKLIGALRTVSRTAIFEIVNHIFAAVLGLRSLDCGPWIAVLGASH